MDALSAIRLPAAPMLNMSDPASAARALRQVAPSEIPNLESDKATRVGDAGGSFENVLGKLVREVNDKQAVAGEAVQGLLSGDNIPLHRVILATEEASVSFQLMVEVRNKLLEAYQELMRMQV
jgi:flagellar hook-basal body complex protein FliE